MWSPKQFLSTVVQEQGLKVRGQRLEIQGQGLVYWSSRTRTFIQVININNKHLLIVAAADN